MIEINGVKFDTDASHKTAEFYKIEQTAKEAWRYLIERHSLSSGKRISMELHKKFKHKKIISNESGDSKSTPILSYPAAIQVSYSTKINFDGRNYVVRYYETKNPTKDPNVFKYKPVSDMVRAPKSYGKKDKDLLLYLYLFSGMVETKFPQTKFSVEGAVNKFYFVDRIDSARQKISKRNKIADATVKLRDLEDEKVRRFSATIGVEDSESAHIDVIRDAIITRIEGVNGDITYVALKSFIDNHAGTIFGIEETVRAASLKKLFKHIRTTREGEKIVEWVYLNENNERGELICTYEGTNVTLESLANYMASNPEAYQVLVDKYESIK